MPSIDSFVFLLLFFLFLISWISISFSFFWFPCKVKVLKFFTSCRRSITQIEKGMVEQLICSYMFIRCFFLGLALFLKHVIFLLYLQFSWILIFHSIIPSMRKSLSRFSSKTSLKKIYVFQNTIFMCRKCVFFLMHLRLINLFDAIVCS